MAEMTWEQAVDWLRAQPEQRALVEACYFDDPLLAAAERFAQSEEWLATLALLSSRKGRALDLGAGRGISSYALAKAGWQVTALEPDTSSLVGSGAIRSLAREANLVIEVVEEFGERLPFPDHHFDLVHGRQVLHHAHNLPQFCREVARVLRPGGQLIATREHVISRHEDLPAFLDTHPLHKIYGGENAFLLREYTDAIQNAGLHVVKQFGPFESAINYFPYTRAQIRQISAGPLARRVGGRVAEVLTDERRPLGKALSERLIKRFSETSDAPGRLYTFLAQKPQT
ncbi:MAG: class I SAM-dependent methyltransferase [bacterium]|nr:class I SAM-dependent methyltransferase [bacterium]